MLAKVIVGIVFLLALMGAAALFVFLALHTRDLEENGAEKAMGRTPKKNQKQPK